MADSRQTTNLPILFYINEIYVVLLIPLADIAIHKKQINKVYGRMKEVTTMSISYDYEI